jgi:hypothetical protein
LHSSSTIAKALKIIHLCFLPGFAICRRCSGQFSDHQGAWVNCRPDPLQSWLSHTPSNMWMTTAHKSCTSTFNQIIRRVVAKCPRNVSPSEDTEVESQCAAHGHRLTGRRQTWRTARNHQVTSRPSKCNGMSWFTIPASLIHMDIHKSYWYPLSDILSA